jgi:esterase
VEAIPPASLDVRTADKRSTPSSPIPEGNVIISQTGQHAIDSPVAADSLLDSLVEDRFVVLGTLRLHYRVWGRPDLPPLMVLHGLNSHAYDWDFLGRALCDRYHVLALTLRGHGESEWADDYSWERMIKDLDGVARALRLDRFSLLGYSIGGAFAYLFAALHPDRVERLIVVDQGVDAEPAFLPRVRMLMAEHRAIQVMDDPEQAVALWRGLDPRAREGPLRHTVRHGLRQIEDGRWTWRDDPVSRSSTRPNYQPEPAVRWEMLARIACPTLLIRAAESELYGRTTVEQMARTIPNCRYVEIPESSHRIHWDQPESLVAAVRSYLLSQ